MTATVSPGRTPAVLNTAPRPVVTPQPIRAARSRGMSSRIFTTRVLVDEHLLGERARARANWKTGAAVAAQAGRLGRVGGGADGCTGAVGPDTQKSQWPQKTERQVMTWSPGLTWVTSEPTASTIPADSWPSTVGVGYGNVPSMKCRSLWHSPAAAVRTSTSWGAGPVDGDLFEDQLSGDGMEDGSAHSQSSRALPRRFVARDVRWARVAHWHQQNPGRRASYV